MLNSKSASRPAGTCRRRHRATVAAILGNLGASSASTRTSKLLHSTTAVAGSSSSINAGRGPYRDGSRSGGGSFGAHLANWELMHWCWRGQGCAPGALRAAAERDLGRLMDRARLQLGCQLLPAMHLCGRTAAPCGGAASALAISRSTSGIDVPFLGIPKRTTTRPHAWLLDRLRLVPAGRTPGGCALRVTSAPWRNRRPRPSSQSSLWRTRAMNEASKVHPSHRMNGSRQSAVGEASIRSTMSLNPHFPSASTTLAHGRFR